MARYDVVVVGAGLGGLTAGAILARAGRKVLVVERSNSVGGAASSYKSGDLFVEGSLHETSDPHHTRDPKHDVLTRAGVIDAVKWIPAGAFYQARGGPLDRPFLMPDNFDTARRALGERFPEVRAGIDQLLGEMQRIVAVMGEFPQSADTLENPDDASARIDAGPPRGIRLAAVVVAKTRSLCSATMKPSNARLPPTSPTSTTIRPRCGGSISRWRKVVICKAAAATSRAARSGFPARLPAPSRPPAARCCCAASSLPLRSVMMPGPSPTPPRTAATRRSVEALRIIGNAAPAALGPLMPADAADKLTQGFARQTPSTSLFALTLGLKKPPREFGVAAYSTQLLPPWMKRLTDYAQGAALMAEEPD